MSEKPKSMLELLEESEKNLKKNDVYCHHCAFSDCLRGGCVGQCVLLEDLPKMKNKKLSFEEMFQHVKYSKQIPENEYINIKPEDVKSMRQVWLRLS